MLSRVFVGLPIWNRSDWTGELYPAGTPSGERLAAYARVFNAVEGNATFYAIPASSTIERWAAQTGPDFHFCFKLPRAITHDRMLVNAGREADAFMSVIEPLRSRLGPVLVQLPARFAPARLPLLEDFLLALPPLASYAVEVRHPGFFEGSAADELDAMLAELGIDRVILDARGVHAAFRAQGDEPRDPALIEAHRRKPDLPAPMVATAKRPVLRYVGDPELAANDERLLAWAQQLAGWIEEGREPHVFMHLPDDFGVPRLARRFFEILSAHTHAGTLPSWPGEHRQPHQVGLFSAAGEGSD